MSGISLLTALEIFSNPDDLEFTVGEQNGRWGFLILRGPGHNYKILLEGLPIFKNIQAVVRVVGQVLERICTDMTQELNAPTTIVAQVTNPDRLPVDDANVLSGQYRERIVADLLAKRAASTCTYKQP